ncbi:hypothetical protein B4135_2576 [Caldibacillus debilis]|uniref:Uncharacterized protein n=1 Tax=Caldibacillus debilis TaxID=301148 RepID=A0A150LXB7_9BACI|nr:hypothetical protein B4135_2576 [Caldibacillus debilis]
MEKRQANRIFMDCAEKGGGACRSGSLFADFLHADGSRLSFCFRLPAEVFYRSFRSSHPFKDEFPALPASFSGGLGF